MTEPRNPPSDLADKTLKKVADRLIPFLVACYCSAYLDRINIGFAAATMNKDLGFSPSVFGWGAGIFFLSYALLEAPSNLLLHRLGAKLWIARIMISWSICSALMAFIWNEASFYSLRFLLGVAEAGFFPGVILYLTYWIPRERRAHIIAMFFIAVPISAVIGAPVSALILSYADGAMGLRGWQWLFIIEAVPSFLLGVVSYFYLTDKPAHAQWLTEPERHWLSGTIAAEEELLVSESESLWSALKTPGTVLFGVAYFGIVLSLYSLTIWMPQITATFGYGVIGAGFITAAPYLLGVAAMFFWGKRSDSRGERYWHTIIPAIVTAVGLATAACLQSPAASILAISVATCGTLATLPTFWALMTYSVSGTTAAVTIALVNSMGNLAGFAGPFFVGWIKEYTGQFSVAFLLLSAGPLLCAAAIALHGRLQKRVTS